MSTSFASAASSSFSSPPAISASTTRWMCFVSAPFFEPVAFSTWRSSGRIAWRICSAADATCSSSRGDSFRSGRIAASRTSSRIFFESSVVIFFASSLKMPETSVRASSSVGSPCSSAQLFRPRVQKSSSSSKPFSAPLRK